MRHASKQDLRSIQERHFQNLRERTAARQNQAREALGRKWVGHVQTEFKP